MARTWAGPLLVAILAVSGCANSLAPRSPGVGTCSKDASAVNVTMSGCTVALTPRSPGADTCPKDALAVNVTNGVSTQKEIQLRVMPEGSRLLPHLAETVRVDAGDTSEFCMANAWGSYSLTASANGQACTGYADLVPGVDQWTVTMAADGIMMAFGEPAGYSRTPPCHASAANKSPAVNPYPPTGPRCAGPGRTPCHNTALRVNITNELATSQEVHLLILPEGGQVTPHFNQTLFVGAHGTIEFDVPDTDGFYAWTAATDQLTCTGYQDVGGGDYRWYVTLQPDGIKMGFRLDDYGRSASCDSAR